LIAAEEEQLILADRSAGGSSELIALQGIARGGEEIAGVQVPIAQEFKQIAVKLIGAGLSYGVDRGGGVVSILRRNGAGLYLELL
jgi:hypothetical protein